MICCLLLSFKKNLSGTLLECQMVWIQISTDILYICSSFFCLLTVFKINSFKKFIQKYYQGVKALGSRSGLTFCILFKLFFVCWLFSKLTLSKNSLQKYNQGVKQLGSRSGPTVCICSCFYCRLLTVFKLQLFQKILSGTLSECQMVCIQIRTDRTARCQFWYGSKLFAKVISKQGKEIRQCFHNRDCDSYY